MKVSVKNICLCAIIAAAVCTCTLISVPLPIGIFTLGDIAILICAYSQGLAISAIGAGIGASLADILLGYAYYAPATLIIKLLLAAAAHLLFRLSVKKCTRPATTAVFCAISAAIAEVIMVAGYFLYEAFVLNYGAAVALTSVPANALQGICAVVISQAVIFAMRKRHLHKTDSHPFG